MRIVTRASHGGGARMQLAAAPRMRSGRHPGAEVVSSGERVRGRASVGLSVLLALSGCHEWTMKDTVLQAGFVAVTTIDWMQTNGITARCNETNPILGDCGQHVPVGFYFPLALV